MNTRGKVVKPNGDYSCLHFLIISHCCWVRVEAPLFTGPHEHYLDGRFRALPASVKQEWKISRLLGSRNTTQWSNHIATNSFCQVRDGKLASRSAPQTQPGRGNQSVTPVSVRSEVVRINILETSERAGFPCVFG